jgi:hypothetical protein
MADQFCPNCGTEVEEDARFCPSCGTTLSAQGSDGEESAAIPPAPAWPEPEAPEEEPTRTIAPEPVPPPAIPSPPPASPPPPPPPAEAPGQPSASAPDLPFTWPTTLSGWLIGAGMLIGALALIPRLAGAGYLLSLLLFLVLLGIAATVFFGDHVPRIPQLRLIVLSTALVGLGVGLARAAFTIQGIDTLFLVAMLAAAGGALLIELDRDRPFPPPDRSGS